VIEYRTSSFCDFGNCVEVGRTPEGSFLVRDNKNPDQSPLEFSSSEWSAFVSGVKNGEFDAV
jgi:hypothetical protein